MSSRIIVVALYIAIWSGHSKVVRPNTQCGLAKLIFSCHTKIVEQPSADTVFRGDAKETCGFEAVARRPQNGLADHKTEVA
jgi:hypothetical protein